MSGGSRVSTWRVALGAVGLAAAAFGGQQLLTSGRATALGSSLAWLAGVLVVHDVVLAPAVAAVGLLVRRRVVHPAGRRALAVAAGGLLVAGVLCLVVAVMMAAPPVPGNPTVRPRDYEHGLAALLVADLLATLGVLAGGALFSRGRRTGQTGAEEQRG